MKLAENIIVACKYEHIIGSRDEIIDLFDRNKIQYPEHIDHELYSIITGLFWGYVHICFHTISKGKHFCTEYTMVIDKSTEFWRVREYDLESYNRQLKRNPNHIIL